MQNLQFDPLRPKPSFRNLVADEPVFSACVRSGMVLHSFLAASRDIEEGEEVTWCYGYQYHRDYDTSCPNYRSKIVAALEKSTPYDTSEHGSD
jgi:hypothetical protein